MWKKDDKKLFLNKKKIGSGPFSARAGTITNFFLCGLSFSIQPYSGSAFTDFVLQIIQALELMYSGISLSRPLF
jgi:hypothetical protein